MALPNLCAPTKVEGRNAVASVGTTATTILSNAAASGKTLRVVGLKITNTDATTTYAVDADLYDGSTGTKFAAGLDVAAKTTVSLITKDSPLYLEEGDSVRLTTSAANKLDAIASYEEVT